MQLDKRPGSAHPEVAVLALAVANLLAVTSSSHASGTEVEQSTLFYNESERVRVLEPVIQVHQQLSGDRVLSVKYTFDALSGASPNGARPLAEAQTFTSPSGKSYSTVAGDLPTREFRDQRHALSVDYELPLPGVGRLWNFGVNASHESDYDAIGLSTSIRWDLFDRHSTLSLSLAYSHETLEPKGGLQDPMSFLGAESDEEVLTGESQATKKVEDLLIGWSQVMNPAWLLQLNLGVGRTHGYLGDPYKLVSTLDLAGHAVGYLYEGRPDTRLRKTLLLRSLHHLERDVLRLSWRYFSDDWGIESHALKAAWWIKPDTFLGKEGWRFRPRLRYSHQSKADFFRQNLWSMEEIPAFASSDMRLGELDSWTIGLRVDFPETTFGSFNLRLDRFIQSWTVDTDPIAGIDPAPDLKTWVLGFGWKRAF